jgi:hypothetical protein
VQESARFKNTFLISKLHGMIFETKNILSKKYAVTAKCFGAKMSPNKFLIGNYQNNSQLNLKCQIAIFTSKC